MTLITINEASSISAKSVQTIRRMIKQKKIKVKKQTTPQGFNYLIIKESLLEFVNQHTQAAMQQTAPTQDISRTHRSINETFEALFKAESERFNTTIQKLIEQNEKDKTNFFQLVKTFQERVFALENQIKLLEAPKARWWKFWK